MYSGLSLTELEVVCGTSGVPGRQDFFCGFSNDVVSVMCSFDDGPFENCTFPLVVGIEEFGTENHTLVVTVVDVFGQSVSAILPFQIAERKKFLFISSLHYLK